MSGANYSKSYASCNYEQFASLENFVQINPESITKNYPSEEIEYIDISCVGSGHLTEPPSILNLKTAPSRARRIVRRNDTILAMVRPNLRSFLFIKRPSVNTIVSTGFAVLRAKKNADARFIYYAVTNPNFTAYLSKNAKGTSYPAVDTDTILRGTVPNISLPVQKKIAAYLASYDDLIENNRRRIKLLEQAAKLLYREWFVHLRFPGHDTTPITNGLPQGWKDGSIGDVAEVKSGFAFKSKDWQENGHPVIKIKNITGNGGVDIEDCQCVPDAVAEKAVRFRIQSGSILIAMTGATVGKIGVMPATNRHYYLNQRVGEFQSKKKFAISAFLFSALNADSVQSQVNNLAAGAAQPNISAKQIESLKITVPTDELLQRFSAFAEAGFKQSLVLQLQNQKLAEARDILLPRLMNGEVAV